MQTFHPSLLELLLNLAGEAQSHFEQIYREVILKLGHEVIPSGP